MALPTVLPGTWKSIPGTRLATGNPSQVQPLFTSGNHYVTFLSGKGDDGVNNANGTWAYSGLSYDSIRHKVLSVCNGGHNDGADNGVYEYDIETTQGWSMALQPTYTSPGVIIPTIAFSLPAYYNDATGVYGPAGNRPCSRHSYYGQIFMPTVGANGKVWLAGGSKWDAGGEGTGEIWHYDPVTHVFDLQTGLVSGLAHIAVWNSVTSRVIFHDTTGLYEWNPIGPTKTLINADGRPGDSAACCFDSLRNKFVELSWYTGPTFSGDGFTTYDGSSGWARVTHAWSGSKPTLGVNNGASFGLLYDPIRDKYIVWVGQAGLTNRLYSFDPVTFAGTALDLPGNTPPTGLCYGAGGEWGRFFYYPPADVYLLFNQPTDQAFAARHPDSVVTAPQLAFTDVAQVKRTGNSDTSHGQTLNQHGGFVTVWGTNLGTSQGTSTITVGGVAPAVIYGWGNAVPPLCPANLYNGYQRLQCIVFQIAATTPTGAQNIVVTVGGVASNAASVNVTTLGSIYFAALSGGGLGTYASPFAGFQTGIEALRPNDTLYVLNGTDTPSGTSMSVWTTPSGNPSNLPMAIVGYPNALSQVGDSTHIGFNLGAHDGSGQGVVYAKFNLLGANEAVSAQQNSRIVGNTIQCPTGTGLSGAVGASWSNIAIFGNEIYNTGSIPNFDGGYHTIYISGHRDVATPVPESNREVAWNYMHDNRAARAINIFNAFSTASNPISDHKIHDNVIVNQEQSAILFGEGIVGNNWIYNNLLINVGLSNLNPLHNEASVGLQMQAGYPRATPSIPVDPNNVYIFNNTLLRCGDSRASARGAISFAFPFSGATPVTYSVWNNIVDQDNGLPYVMPGSDQVPTLDATKRSHNLWFGAGESPTWDTSPLNVDPLLVDTTSPVYDGRLQSTSQARSAAVNLTSGGLGLTDLDGGARGTTWDIGAYQFATTLPTGPVPTVDALSPASCLPGAATFTLDVFGTNYDATAVVNWDGTPLTGTILFSTAQLKVPIPAALVASIGTHIVSVTTTAGGTSSTTKSFTVSLGPANVALAWNGLIRDRVGPGPLAMAPDTHLDGTLTLTFTAISGRTVTALQLGDSGVVGSQWDTVVDAAGWILGVAADINSTTLLNNPTSGAVSFTPADGSSIALFASAEFAGLFALGSTLTVTVTFSDTSTVIATTTVGVTSTITSLNPATGEVAHIQHVGVFGTGFVAGISVVSWDGVAQPTTFSSATQVTFDISIPMATLGAHTVTVAGSTGSLTFTVTAAPPPTQQRGVFVSSVM